jgi:hypothetical protein
MNKKILKTIVLLAVLFTVIAPLSTFASRDSVIGEYKQELINQGASAGDAQTIAADAVDSTINAMASSQEGASTKYDELKNRVDSLTQKDNRKDDAQNSLDDAKGAVGDFKDLDPGDHVMFEAQLGGVPPKAVPDDEFISAEGAASEALNKVNRILIAPSQPGNVPAGNLMTDFIPQLVRQLFRFAWLAVLVAFVTSGIFFIISYGNEERLGKAKRMIYFTFLGFAFVTLAFAIVKAITDIDFFSSI